MRRRWLGSCRGRDTRRISSILMRGPRIRSIRCASGIMVVRISRAREAAAAAGRESQALDYALAILSGVLLTLSFPKFGHPAFGWVALLPLFIATTRSAELSFDHPRP